MVINFLAKVAKGLKKTLAKFSELSTLSNSVAYRYRKSISIIELFVSIISIYIEFLETNF